MNEHRLYVNGQQVDLVANKPLAYTMQVNDIGNIANRQSNFSRTIDIPFTPKNIQIFEFLGVIGTETLLPYNKITIDYYVGNDCIIYNGWGQITESDIDSYKLHIYDGVIDLYKSISDNSLSVLNLEELDHTKNLSGVTTTWENDLPYKYILADYNGKAKYNSGNNINIDYLVPSVKVSYLWEKIFDYSSSTYEGSIFENEDFTNLWMTFPKGVVSTLPDIEKYYSEDLDWIENDSPFKSISPFLKYRKSTFLKQFSNEINELDEIIDNIHFKVVESGNYRIKIDGRVLNRMYINNSDVFSIYGSIPVKCDMWLAINSEGDDNADNATLLTKLKSNLGSDYSGSEANLETDKVISLESGNTYSIVMRYSGNNVRWLSDSRELNNSIKLTINKVDSTTISFSDGFKDFKMKDFFSEILNRFSLTPFKDKYTNHYKFLTLEERIKEVERIDWSDKLNGIKNEKYIYGNYGQNNTFHHKYNDDASNYFDGYIRIENKNLTEEKSLIDSKIYVPEKLKNFVDFPFESNIYKLWDKEINENDGVQEVNYKELDKRFYFLKSVDYTFSSPQSIGSQALGTSISISTLPIESFEELSYLDTVGKYYPLVSNIISNVKLITAELNLTSTDIANFDFSKLYFFKQLGGYYYINKISNWQENKLTNVELIKLGNYIEIPNLSGTTDSLDGTEYYITITNYQVINIDAWVKHIVIDFETNITSSQLKVYGNPIPNSSPYTYVTSSTGFPSLHTLTLESLDGTVVSNAITWWG